MNPITLNESQLSDVWFNHQKDALSEFYKRTNKQERGGLSNEEYKYQFDLALRRDAEDFSEMLGGQVPVLWLVNDYNRRL